MRDLVMGVPAADRWEEQETKRIALGAIRVGRHVFARNACQLRLGCVFCGFMSPQAPNGMRMLLAGHIEPRKDSFSRERLDLRKGLAVCPAYDAALDKGMITVGAKLVS